MKEIDQAIKDVIAGKEAQLSYNFISEERSQEMYYLLLMVLGYLDKLFLVEVVYTVLKEVLMNANKANAKREYFKRMGLDVHNPEDYTKGMVTFHEDIILNWEEQDEYLTGSSFYILISIKLENGNMVFTVDNNAPILPEELKRVQKRIEAAKQYTDLSDAFMDMGDTTESAGLGLILSMILLRNSGVGMERFHITSTDRVTRATLTVPPQTIPLEVSTKLKTRILNETEGVPPLPTSLTKIINLCSDPDSDLNVISAEIQKNPALSADLLKLSNSAGFASRTKSSTIVQAVKVVGLKNVRNMLYVSGVRKIMDGQYGKMQEVWDHSNRTSFYARQIANEFGKMKYADIVACGALLHDIGKLILLSIDKVLWSKIIAYQKGKDMSSSTILEEISLGVSHPTLGGQLARKWEFPEDLTAMIEYHHRPFMTPPKFKEFVDIVYLANMMVDVVDSKKGFFAVDKRILKDFNLDNKDKFEDYCKRVEKLFKTHGGDQY